MIRIALGCLIVGAIAGLLAASGAPVFTGRVHMDLMLPGFMIQFALGTAAWILPKKGGVRPVGGAAAVFNIGLGLTIAAQILGGGLAETVGRVVMIAGAAWLVGALWPRVRRIVPVRHA